MKVSHAGQRDSTSWIPRCTEAERSPTGLAILLVQQGVLIYFPFLRPFSRLMVDWFGAGSMSVAWAHLIFNVTVGLAFLLLLDKAEPVISKK